jgi:hypothetical protein
MDFRIIQILMLTIVASVLRPGTVCAQNFYPQPTIPYRDRLEVKQKVLELVNDIGRSEVASYGLDAASSVTSSVNVEFDEEALQKDARQYYTQAENLRKQSLNEFDSNRKKLLQEVEAFQKRILESRLAAQKERAQKLEQAIPNKGGDIRFGRLNIDVKKESLAGILSAEEKKLLAEIESKTGDGIGLSVAVPSGPVFSDPIPEFRVNASLYLKKITVEMAVPSFVTQVSIAKIREKISIALELDRLSGGKGIEWVTIQPFSLPPLHKRTPKVSVGEWIASLFQPDNLTIGIVAAGISMALALLVGVFLLTRSLTGLAQSIRELKPQAESEGGSSGGSDDVVEIAEASAESADSVAKYDSVQSTQALTSEMKTIRSQLEDVIRENAQAAAEVLRDLFYQPKGLEDFRDLLGFAGYSVLKDAMRTLPRSALDELKGYIEDSRDSSTSLLNGVEVAQRIYRDTISKMTGADTSQEELAKFREALINSEDDILNLVISGASPEEVALILNTLTVERGNKIAKNLSADLLKQAASLMDQDPKPEVIDGLVSKMTGTKIERPSSSKAQRRFTLRLIKNTPVDQEETIKHLIPPDDWELRKTLMEQHFLYSDIPLLPMEAVRQILDGFELSTRAEIIFTSVPAVKEALLASYAQGSKLKEMVETEISELSKNAKRQEALTKRRLKLLDALMARVRKQVTMDTSLVDFALKRLSAQTGVPYPNNKVA